MMTNETGRGGQTGNESSRDRQPAQDQDAATTKMVPGEEDLEDEDLEDDFEEDEDDDVEEVSADEDTAVDNEEDADQRENLSGDDAARS